MKSKWNVTKTTIGEFILIPVVWAIRMTPCFVCVLFTQGNGRRDGTKNLVQIAAAVGKFILIIIWAISMTLCFVHSGQRTEAGVRKRSFPTTGYPD